MYIFYQITKNKKKINEKKKNQIKFAYVCPFIFLIKNVKKKKIYGVVINSFLDRDAALLRKQCIYIYILQRVEPF